MGCFVNGDLPFSFANDFTVANLAVVGWFTVADLVMVGWYFTIDDLENASIPNADIFDVWMNIYIMEDYAREEWHMVDRDGAWHFSNLSDCWSLKKMDKKKPLVFFDVSIDGDPIERMIFELFTDVAPKTAENFRALCTGEKGDSPKAKRPLHYKGTFFHRIIKGSLAQGGDLLRRDGNYGESIYGGKFPDESPKLKHDCPGLLSMAIVDRDERGSLFSITFKADHHLDRKSVVFGKLVDGYEVLKKIESAGDEDGRPAVTVKIINSGELCDVKKKGSKLKMGKDSIDGDGHEVRRKGKHKKSSKERRKRRRYYTSESDSSSDTDIESSESDSESDSYASSLSDSSSSSDDRRRKRKRSKKDRQRRRKRKDRRRDKRRKRRDKKSKRKSKRDSLSESESENRSGSSSEDNGVEIRESDMKHKSPEVNQSPLRENQEVATVHHRKGEVADMFEREEGEFPRENGEHRINGIEGETRSDKSADRHPDVVDDHPSKSRSRSLSPKRSMSKSMSISPKRSKGRSPSVSARHDMSRSPSVSRSPQQIAERSRSNSPVRSGSSRSPVRSPVRGRKGRSVSVSPRARSQSRRSPSRSPTVSPPRRRVTRSPPRTSSRRSSLRSVSRSPVRSSRRSPSRSSGKPPRRSASRSPVRSSRISVSRSSGRGPPRRSPSPSPVRAPSRNNRRSYSRSPVGAGRRARSPVSDRGRSSSRSPPVDESPKRIRRGRGFSDRYSYVRRYRSRSPDRSPVRTYRYGARNDRDRYSSYRRSPRRYRSPPRGRTPPRYRGRRSRTRSPSVSRSPIRYRNRRYSRSPIRSRSPVERYRPSPRAERRRSPSVSRSPSKSRSPLGSQSPKRGSKDDSRSSSESPPRKTGLVSYGDGSPDSDRD
ncbi:peptidyl-prolyl cis-trans isomerase CYP95 [Forsythia ovata]|uniref:peptidylprolyl isomerase n=1 Tax=Forsythia ovata TaxID=205694 RepID=A0ABD1WHU8_9LAMI